MNRRARAITAGSIAAILLLGVVGIWMAARDHGAGGANDAGGANGANNSQPAAPMSTWTLNLPPFVPQVDPKATAEKPIAPNVAATVDLPDGAQATLGAEAVREPTTFKMSRLLNKPPLLGTKAIAGDVYDLSLGDGSKQPNQPVQLKVPIPKQSPGQDPSKLALARWDGVRWRPLATSIDPAKGTATTSVDHFSSYALVNTTRFESGPGELWLMPGGDQKPDHRVPRGSTVECVTIGPPGASYDSVWIKDVEILGRDGAFKMGSGPVTTATVGAYSESRFVVRVPAEAEIGHRSIEMFGRQEGRQTVGAGLFVCAPLVVIIDIDGMRKDVFNDRLANPPAGYVHIPRLFGKGSGEKSAKDLKFLEFERGIALTEATTIFPSVTFAGHACIFSGADLGQLKMAGNEWFDRKIQRKFGFTLDLGDTRGSYTGEDFGAFKFGGVGVANARMHASLVPTVYEEARSKLGYSSICCHNMYYQGAEWFPYTWIKDELEYYFCPFSHWAEDSMRDKAVRAYERNHMDLGIITLYYAGGDHHGHERSYPADLAERQGVYLVDNIDGNFGKFLESMSDAMYKNATYLFIADHGQTGMTRPRGSSAYITSHFGKSRSMPDLPKLQDMLWEAGFVPGGTSCLYTLPDNTHHPVEPANGSAVAGLNGGMAQIYLRHSGMDFKPTMRIGTAVAQGPELLAIKDTFESWEKPARYRDVLHVAKHLATMLPGGSEQGNYAGSIDVILVRNTDGAQNEDDYRTADYKVYRSDTEQVPLLDFLRSEPGKAWMTSKGMGYAGTDRDARFIADRIRRLQSSVSGDLIILPRYPDFYFEYAPLYGDHGSITRTDMEIVFAVARPGLEKPDLLLDVLHDSINLRSKPRPANTDVKKTVLNLLQKHAKTEELVQGPLKIKTSRFRTQTVIEVESEALAKLDPAAKDKGLRYVLYRATSPDGPWVNPNKSYPTRDGALVVLPDTPMLAPPQGPNAYIQTGRLDANRVQIVDTWTQRDPKEPMLPYYYRVGQTNWTQKGSVGDISGIEQHSNVVPPGKVFRIVVHGKEQDAAGKTVTWRDAGQATVNAWLTLEEQGFSPRDTHLVATRGSFNAHFWTDKIYGSSGQAKIPVPPEGGEITVGLVDEAYGTVEQVTVTYPPDTDLLARREKELATNKARTKERLDSFQKWIESAEKQIRDAEFALAGLEQTSFYDAQKWVDETNKMNSARNTIERIKTIDIVNEQQNEIINASFYTGDYAARLNASRKQLALAQLMRDLDLRGVSQFEENNQKLLARSDVPETTRTTLDNTRKSLADRRREIEERYVGELAGRYLSIGHSAFYAGDAAAYAEGKLEYLRLSFESGEKKYVTGLLIQAAPEFALISGQRKLAAEMVLMDKAAYAAAEKDPKRLAEMEKYFNEEQPPSWWPPDVPHKLPPPHTPTAAEVAALKTRVLQAVR